MNQICGLESAMLPGVRPGPPGADSRVIGRTLDRELGDADSPEKIANVGSRKGISGCRAVKPADIYYSWTLVSNSTCVT